MMEERGMSRTFLPATLTVLVAITSALIRGQEGPKGIVGLKPAQVHWFTPTYYTDGRQRAQLYGDSNHGGPWIDRVKIPAGKHVTAHTHPQDELVTVIDGTWYVGVGDKYDPAKLEAYPAGSFVVIPAGLPHFVAAKETAVIVQLSGAGKFRTDTIEK
jgi:quercetin dioxygenase-like cupin family protein